MSKTTTRRGRARAWPVAIVSAMALAFAIGHVPRQRDESQARAPTDDVAIDAIGASSAMTMPTKYGAERRMHDEAPEFDTSGSSGLRLEERTPNELVAQALGGATITDRAAALDALAYAAPSGSGNEDYVWSTLAQALVDPDERIRGQALATLKDVVLELPESAVAQVARDDPSPALRVQALELLVERSGDGALEPLRLALADPEPAVHDRARALVDDLHLAFEVN